MRVTYKQVIIIDDQEHTILSCDYSDSISEAIANEIVEDDEQDVIDFIVSDLQEF